MNHVERTLATARGIKALTAPPSVDEADNFENYNDEDSPFFFNQKEEIENREERDETESYREEKENSEDRYKREKIEKSKKNFFDQTEDKEEILDNENENENSALKYLKPLKIADTREIVYFFTKEIFIEISQNNAYKESTEMQLIAGMRRRRRRWRRDLLLCAFVCDVRFVRVCDVRCVCD
jgi:hypothetical protein